MRDDDYTLDPFFLILSNSRYECRQNGLVSHVSWNRSPASYIPTYNHQTVHYIIFTIALIIQSAFFVGIIIELLLLFTFCYYLAIRSNTRSQRLRRQWVFFNFLSNTFLENVWWWVMTNLYPCYFNLPKPLDAIHSIQPHFARISYDSYMTSIFKQVGQVQLLKQRVGLVDGSSFFFFF